MKKRRSMEQRLSSARKTAGTVLLRSPADPRGEKTSSGRLRRGVLLLLLLAAGFTLGSFGGQWLHGGRFAISRLWSSPPPGDLIAWIEPPLYTGLPSIPLATLEEGARFPGTVRAPLGSVLHVEYVGPEPAPELRLADKAMTLESNDNGGFKGKMDIAEGNSIALYQGWKKIAAWKVNVVRDMPPKIAFIEKPSTVNGNFTRLSYEIADDFGVTGVVAHVSPKGIGAQDKTAESVVLNADILKSGRIAGDYDLTFLPWAGEPVDIRLEAVDSAGHSVSSGTESVLLPRRSFLHPLARALIEERKKLLNLPDEATRNKAASVMAGIARETADTKGDPLVFMALRTGAVRLILDSKGEAVPAVSMLLWQTAARIEDSLRDKAGKFLRQATQNNG